jgi:hypothetical protein
VSSARSALTRTYAGVADRSAQRYPSAERWPPRPSTISSRLPSPGLRHSSRFAPSFRTTYRPRLCLIVVPSVQLSPFRPLAD